MAKNVDNVILEILKRIQTDVGGLKFDVGVLKTDMSEVKGRLTSLETTARKIRRDNVGMLLMMRATAGHFEERVSYLEEEVEILMQAKE